MFKSVNVVSIAVSKWEEAKAFYGKVLNWPVAYASDEMGWVEYGRDHEAHVSITLWRGPDPMPTPIPNSGATLVLTVDDAHKTTEALRAMGVKCDDVVVIPGIVAYGSFYDPDGNRLQFAGPPTA
jgi:predicted enzyme related to lactoylglutathione lyase